MYLQTSQEMRLLDELSIHRYKIPAAYLMKRAGKEVFRVIKRKVGRLKRKKAVLFCGPGNNGGDGLVVARYLRKAGAEVSVFHLKSDKPDFKKLKKPDLVVDALFGTGLSRPHPTPLRGAALYAVKRGRLHGHWRERPGDGFMN